jgi:sugar phosphate isomerase/epimerase
LFSKIIFSHSYSERIERRLKNKMKTAFFAAPFQGKPLDEILETMRESFEPEELSGVEIGTGAYPGDQLGLDEHVDKPEAQATLTRTLKQRDFELAALSCHGNPVHPLKDKYAVPHDRVLRGTVRLASQLKVGRVVGFSGLPGDGKSETPIWCVNPWPDEFAELWARQLDVMADYWDPVSREADTAGVDIALEMHPNMFVHNPQTLHALRDRLRERQKGLPEGPGGRGSYKRIGANLDWSHLGWRGMEPEDVCRSLTGIIYFMHGKEYLVNPSVVRENGNISAVSFGKPVIRPWNFVRLGAGDTNLTHLFRHVRRAGYDGFVSIEHEDTEMDKMESFRKAVYAVSSARMELPAGEMTWAKK